MTEEQIKHMADPLLGWKPPRTFSPDGGISFDRTGSKGTPHEYEREPYGTNIFNAQEAEAMVRHMIDGMPT